MSRISHETVLNLPPAGVIEILQTSVAQEFFNQQWGDHLIGITEKLGVLSLPDLISQYYLPVSRELLTREDMRIHKKNIFFWQIPSVFRNFLGNGRHSLTYFQVTDKDTRYLILTSKQGERVKGELDLVFPDLSAPANFIKLFKERDIELKDGSKTAFWRTVGVSLLSHEIKILEFDSRMVVYYPAEYRRASLEGNDQAAEEIQSVDVVYLTEGPKVKIELPAGMTIPANANELILANIPSDRSLTGF